MSDYFFHMEIMPSTGAGFDEAMRGLSLNKKQGIDGMPIVAEKLAPLGHGHNKFLRQIWAWLEIRAPRYWWQEMDTYKTVSAAQSESTMHTLVKELKGAYEIQKWIEENFEPSSISVQEAHDLRGLAQDSDDDLEAFLLIKQSLPEGFLQTRVVNVNYMTLREMVVQRASHRLPHWQDFCLALETGLPFNHLVFNRS